MRGEGDVLQLVRARTSVALTIHRASYSSTLDAAFLIPYTNMDNVEGDSAVPPIRFKRRKILHSKRIYAQDDAPVTSESQAPDAGTRGDDAPTPPTEPQDEDDSVPNLRDIIRNRKRPHHRLRDAARKAETLRTELLPVEAPREGLYKSRFVAQTGQVMDRDDEQM